MEKAKTYNELLAEIKDYMDGNKLADGECLLMIASAENDIVGVISGSGKELLKTAATYMADDDQLLEMMEAAVNIAKMVKTMKK